MTAPHAPVRPSRRRPVRPRCTAAALLVTASLLTVSLVATPALVGAAEAAAPRVTLKVAKATAVTGAKVKLTGTVSGPSAKAVVVLQRKAGKKWVSVRSTRVKASRKFSVTTTVRQGVTRYRVKVKANARIRGVVTGAVKVTGVKASRPSTVSWTSDPAANAEVQRILDDTNAYRRKQGLPPLVHNAAMSKVATAWSRGMAEMDAPGHNPDYSRQIPAGWRAAAENVAAGQVPTKVVAAWIASPGHRKNLVGDFTHIGIGVVRVPGSPYGIYYTQNFARYTKR